jgi:hypothetical protein
MAGAAQMVVVKIHQAMLLEESSTINIPGRLSMPSNDLGVTASINSCRRERVKEGVTTPHHNHHIGPMLSWGQHLSAWGMAAVMVQGQRGVSTCMGRMG